MKQILFLTITAIIIAGCGSSSSSDNEIIEEDPEDANMTTGVNYTVYPKNKIIKTSTDALIKISHTLDNETSTAVLLSGSATIIREPTQ